MTTTSKDEPKSKPSQPATHLMMFHPRSADSKNFPVRCTRDDGNGAGLYETEGGDKLEVVVDDERNLRAVQRKGDRIVQQTVVSVVPR